MASARTFDAPYIAGIPGAILEVLIVGCPRAQASVIVLAQVHAAWVQLPCGRISLDQLLLKPVHMWG